MLTGQYFMIYSEIKQQQQLSSNMDDIKHGLYELCGFPELVGCSAVSENNMQKRLGDRWKVIKAFSLHQNLWEPRVIHYSVLQVYS